MPMGWMAAAMVGSSLIGANAAESGAETQAAAANRAADLQYKQWQEQVALQEPWRKAGETALNKLIPLATEYTPFGMSQFQADPGYQFRLSEGMKALDRQAAARGGLISGSALKAAERYGQDLGSQEYQNAFNRYQTERATRLQPLQSLAGVGQTAANTLGQAGMTMAGNVGNALMSGGAASAAGQMGVANALSGGLSQYMNYSNQQAQNTLLQQALNQRAYGSGYYPYGGGNLDVGNVS